MTTAGAARASEIGPGQMRIIEVGGVRVALCNVDGKFYAIEDVCTHDDGPLGEGTLLPDGQVECPRHGGRFDARTGRATQMPAIAPVRTFPVRVDGDSVIIEVPHGS